MSEFAQYQLVLWKLGGDDDPFGVIDAVTADGNRIEVVFDDGIRREFVVGATESLQHVTFEEGQRVRIPGVDGIVAVVRAREVVGGVSFYTVEAGDKRQRVMESGLRPAVLTDPLTRARHGEFGGARKFNQRVAARRLMIADRFDELSSLSNARIWSKDHQISVVHRVVTSFPHRFLLADEVGLGKTIEAGLIIKELLARDVVRRVLLVVPAGLVTQWGAELRRKFNLAFSVYQRDTAAAVAMDDPLKNPWALRNQVVTSAKWAAYSEARRKDIVDAAWDLVVFDEAHHVRRRLRANEQVEHQTNLYRLASDLMNPERGDVQSLLLLTATPMQLDTSELYSLVELLDPALFESMDAFESHRGQLHELSKLVRELEQWKSVPETERRAVRTSCAEWLGGDAAHLDDDKRRAEAVRELVSRHKLSDVMIRNRKTEVGGFKKRFAKLWPVQLTDAERAVYREVERYVRDGYTLADETKNNAMGFVMTTFQRLMASSSHALAQALLRRIAKLQDIAEPLDVEGIDEEDLEEKSIADDEQLGAAFGARADTETSGEIHQLQRLVDQLEALELDSKAAALRDGLAEIEREHGAQAKVLIFTQSRDTQRYLGDSVIPGKWTVHLFHGQLDSGQKDAAVEAFKDGTSLQALISTEAGGEGRNLQFCHLLINYDLPWNPMKVEQRIGRVDRIGQYEDVRVYNLYAEDTVEERVVEVLHNRIGLFEETVGGLDPILGSVEKDLSRLFRMSRAESEEAFTDYEVDIEERMRRARERERQLADLIMDRRSLQPDVVAQLKAQAEEREVTHADVQAFVLAALRDLKARAIEDRGAAGVFLLELGDRFEHQFPRIAEEGQRRRITFDPAVAMDHEDVEFVAFGHELMDALVERAVEARFGGSCGARIIFTDEVPAAKGYQFVSALEFSGARPWQELVSVFVHDDGTVDATLGDWLLRRSSEVKDENPWLTAPPVADGTYERAEKLAEAFADQQLIGKLRSVTTSNHEYVEREKERAGRLHEHRRQAANREIERLERRVRAIESSGDPGQRRILPAIRGRLDRALSRLERVEADHRRDLDRLAQGAVVAPTRTVLAVARVDIAPLPDPLVEKAASKLPADLKVHLESRVGRHIPRTPEQIEQEVAVRLGNIEKLGQLPKLSGRLDVANARGTVNILEGLLAAPFRADEMAVAIAAVSYFLERDDAVPDNLARGFRDDFSIARAVAWALGHEELYAQP